MTIQERAQLMQEWAEEDNQHQSSSQEGTVSLSVEGDSLCASQLISL